MYRKILTFILLIFLPCFAHGSEDVKIFFYVNNSLTNLPEPVFNTLQEKPQEDLDEYIIKELVRTGGYEVVETNQYQDADLNTFFVVNARTSEKIKSIILHGVNSSEQYQMQRLVDANLGLPYSAEVITKIKTELKTALVDSGYLNAEIVNVKIETAENGLVNIDIYVNSGSACIVEQIIMPTGYLNFIKLFNFPLDIGSRCNMPEIQDALQQVKEGYWVQGYLQATVDIDRIEYTKNKDKAIIYVKINKGQRTILKVNDHSFSIFKSDILDPQEGGLTYSDLLSLSDSDLRNIITEFYQKQGFASVRVSPPKRYRDKDKNNIISFDVEKGPPSRINEVFLIGGALPISKSEVQHELKMEEGTIFNKNNLIVYRDGFKKILYRFGYNEAVVDDLDFYFSPDKTRVNILIKYEKNTQFIVSKMSFENFPKAIKVSDKMFANMLKVGNPLNLEKKQAISDQLRELMLQNGYLYATVNTQLIFHKNVPPDPQTPVEIIYQAVPGSIVKIGKIYVEGDTFGKVETIKSISYLEEGTVFTQAKLELAQTSILKHALFTSAVIDFRDPKTLENHLNPVDLVIKVRGRNGVSFTWYPGYGTGTGYRVTSNASANNLTSHGLRLTFDARISQERQQQNFELSTTKQILGQTYTLGLEEPLFKFFSLQTPIDMYLIGAYQVVPEALVNLQIASANLFGEWKSTIWGANVNLSLSLSQQNFKAVSSGNSITTIFDASKLLLRDISPMLTVDTRNESGWPTRGFYFNGNIDWASLAFGSQVQYLNLIASIKGYFPIYKRLSGAIYAGVNQVNNIKNNNTGALTVPAPLRTYLMDNTNQLVRGFSTDYLTVGTGPLLWLHYAPNGSGLQCGTTQLLAIGGTQLLYFKMEARYRINNNFGLVAFADSGVNYFTQSETNQLSAAVLANIPPPSPSSSQCVIDQAALISNPAITGGPSFFKQYWDKTYMSVGPGIRVILGSFMTVNLDYGYPLKDPTQHQSGCVSVNQALNSSTPPACVSRIQSSTFIWKNIKYRGAFNFGIEAQL